jgi:phytoene dehydrogenase-like protein
LLISAQATSTNANALYSAAALDLARQGISHVPGGMGGLAEKLVQAVERLGGQVIYRHEAVRVIRKNDNAFQVQTKRKDSFIADAVIFNLPPWNISAILGENSPSRFRRLSEHPRKGWGAFMVYAGLDGEALPIDSPLHHQIIVREPLGEGNSIFMSLSPDWDGSRAPEGKRALTISTHTKLEPWWILKDRDHGAYEARKSEYTEKLLNAAKSTFPGIRTMVELALPGTPVTFERFTRRRSGWVGGFPQTSLFESWGPRIERGLWMVGDSIFPGQSVPAVSLGGLRVAHSVLRELSSSSEKILIKFGQANAWRNV